MPESLISANLPRVLVKPFGTTVLYSNQKSNKSPIKKMAAASFFTAFNQDTNFFSLGSDSSLVGAPK